MQKLTRSNVAHDLNISPHKAHVLYTDETEMCFVFSSDLYKRKFEEKLWANRDTVNDSLSKRFGFTVRNNILSDLKLYLTIEKRGFLLFYNGVKVECLSELILDGVLLITKH